MHYSIINTVKESNFDKEKAPTECVNIQPGLFDNDVNEAHRNPQFIVPHFVKNRKKKKRRKRRTMNQYQIQSRQAQGQQLAKDNTRFDRYANEKLILSSNGKIEYKVDLKAN